MMHIYDDKWAFMNVGFYKVGMQQSQAPPQVHAMTPLEHCCI